MLLTLAKRTFRKACSACGCGVSNSHSETAFFASHAHFARRLQIDPEIVEVNASFGIDDKFLDHHLVDAGVRLAEADLGRLDDMIEQRHHLRDVERSAAQAS